MISSTTQARDVVLFGPFALSPAERLLTREGSPIQELQAAVRHGACSASTTRGVRGLLHHRGGGGGGQIRLVNGRIHSVKTQGDRCYLPELLRLKAHLTRQDPAGNPDEADSYLQQALQLSQQPGARAWELRAAIDIAGRLVNRGRIDAARRILQPTADLFTEGRETADLQAASELLARLHSV